VRPCGRICCQPAVPDAFRKGRAWLTKPHLAIRCRRQDLPRTAPPGLVVHFDRPGNLAEDAAVLRRAIRQYFDRRADASRRRLRELFHRGRISLLIGLAFLVLAVGASRMIGSWLNPGGMAEVLRESLLIGGWVAMWRPLEVFLYDWWPIRAEARLFDRLAAMPVRVKVG